MDVLAQWPARLTRGDAPEAAKTAAEDDVSLLGVVRKLAAAAVRWEVDQPDFEKVAAELPKDATTRAPVSKTNIWRHPDAHALVLLTLVLDRYGQDGMEWEPETLRLTLARDGLQLSQSAWTKIMAARVVLHSPSPWRQWNAFHVTCRGLAGVAPNFHYLEIPELGHLMAGADAMHVLDPRRETSDEVDKFVAAALKHDGIPYAPAPIDFAQHELEEPELDCKNCGAVHRDDCDTKCVTCGSTLLMKRPYVFAALRDATRDLVEKRRKMPLDRALSGLPETSAGQVASRLLVATDFARRSRAAMTSQLRMLR